MSERATREWRKAFLNPRNQTGLRGDAYEPDEMNERDRYREALERIAHLADGQEGRTAQTMMMHGFSPVKSLQDAIHTASEALAPHTASGETTQEQGDRA